MFIDLGNKKFLYLQSTYFCGDTDGIGGISGADVSYIFQYLVSLKPMHCNPPTINYEILDYNNYVGTNIIRPNRCIYDD